MERDDASFFYSIRIWWRQWRWRPMRSFCKHLKYLFIEGWMFDGCFRSIVIICVCVCVYNRNWKQNLCGISGSLRLKIKGNDRFPFRPHIESKYTQLQPSFYGRVCFIFIYLFLFVAFKEPASWYEESTNKDEVSFISILLEVVFVLLLLHMVKVDHSSPTGSRTPKTCM